MALLNPIIGRAIPSGPRPGTPPVGLHGKAGAGLRLNRGRGGSKKGSAGTRAGFGRKGQYDSGRARGPSGPGFGANRSPAVQLPSRQRFPAAAAAPPSLMTRIGARMRRTAASLGF